MFEHSQRKKSTLRLTGADSVLPFDRWSKIQSNSEESSEPLSRRTDMHINQPGLSSSLLISSNTAVLQHALKVLCYQAACHTNWAWQVTAPMPITPNDREMRCDMHGMSIAFPSLLWVYLIGQGFRSGSLPPASTHISIGSVLCIRHLSPPSGSCGVIGECGPFAVVLLRPQEGIN